ncbi:MAG: response regulator [Williamsia sp.]|nr:response regulator [Williamsia sp.]
MKQVFRRVVLIDDEEIQNKIHKMIIQHYLGRHSIEIVSFTDPVKALLYLEDEDKNKIPTLVLLDLHMPYMDGWEFLDRLNPLDVTNTVIHIVSASILKADVERGHKNSQIAGFTNKPLSSAVNGLLVATLADIIRRQSLK